MSSTGDGGAPGDGGSGAPPPRPASPPPRPASPAATATSHLESFGAGLLGGPEAYVSGRAGIGTEFSTPLLDDVADVTATVGLAPMADLGRAAYQALPEEHQHAVQGVAAREAGTLTGSLATGAAVGRMARAIPDRRVRTAATVLSVGLSALAITQAPRRAAEGLATRYPDISSGATEAMGAMAALEPEQQRAAVTRATAELDALPRGGGTGGSDGGSA